MFEAAIRQFTPRPQVRALDWSREHVCTADGRPYDHGAYPHLGAPGGPFDAFDQATVQSIWLQWASRLGKSFFGQCCTLKTAACDPSPMMFVSAREKLAIEVVSRTYEMLGRCSSLADQVRPESRRRQDQIELDHCRVYVGWARSAATLADKAVRVGHANEIDKWEHVSTSKEGDPLKLFENRFKEFPDRKKILESTPSIKKRSRVERGLLGSTNCRLHVPCPHCRRYQQLQLGRGEAGGLVWDKLPNGRHDPDLAWRTARYLCAHCSQRKPILDESRAWMMRRGVWCPEGCQVDSKKALAIMEQALEQPAERPIWSGWSKAAWVTGQPLRDGPDAGYQLGSLYAISLSFGDYAREFVSVKDRPGDLHDFVNGWQGETWEVVARQQTWEQLYDRISSEIPQRTIPPTFSLVTIGIDKQQDHHVYCATAWGPGRSSHILDYGQRESLDELYHELIDFLWPHADGGASLRAVLTLIDSGFRPKGVYEFCRACQAKSRRVYPCKGSSTPLDTIYRITTLGPNTSMPGMRKIDVDTRHTQEWVERQLHEIERGQPGAATVFAGSKFDHQDLCEQLLNDAPVGSVDAHNYATEHWERIDKDVPNDLRDAARYSLAAMMLATRGAPIAARGSTPPTPPRSRPRLTMPDGRPFFIGER